MSETKRYRKDLVGFCEGYGVDLGYGGDPIKPSAITMDLPQPYTKLGAHPLNLGGDARDLYWFSDNSLDYVYSSHLLEDFAETGETLKEWARILKKGGKLVLLLPDQKRYEAHCRKHGTLPNEAHKIKDFSLSFVKKIAAKIPNLRLVFEKDYIDQYSFAIVFEKTEKTQRNGQVEVERLEEIIKKKSEIVDGLQSKISLLEKEMDSVKEDLSSRKKELHEIRSSLRWKIPNYLYKLYRKLRRSGI